MVRFGGTNTLPEYTCGASAPTDTPHVYAARAQDNTSASGEYTDAASADTDVVIAGTDGAFEDTSSAFDESSAVFDESSAVFERRGSASTSTDTLSVRSNEPKEKIKGAYWTPKNQLMIQMNHWNLQLQRLHVQASHPYLQTLGLSIRAERKHLRLEKRMPESIQ